MALYLTINGTRKDLQTNDCTIGGIKRIAATGQLVAIESKGAYPNLCLNSIDEKIPSNENLYIPIPFSTLKPNTTYTWSFDAKYNGNTATHFEVYTEQWLLPDGTYSRHMFKFFLQSSISIDFQRFSVTFSSFATLPTTGNLLMGFYCLYGTGTIPIARRWKLEENNYASPYLPHVSDDYYWNECTVNDVTKTIGRPTTYVNWSCVGATPSSGRGEVGDQITLNIGQHSGQLEVSVNGSAYSGWFYDYTNGRFWYTLPNYNVLIAWRFV